jgi:thymidylate synthase
MLTLVALQQDVATRLDVKIGTYSHFVMSYHLYVRDILAAAAAFPGGAP